MAQQLEFVLRNDGFWWAPPINPQDTIDFTISFAQHLAGDTIEEILSVTSTFVDVELYSATVDNLGVTVWLTNTPPLPPRCGRSAGGQSNVHSS